jgi:hypothetical protein
MTYFCERDQRPVVCQISSLFLSCLQDVFRLGKIPSQESQYTYTYAIASLEDFLKWGLLDYFPPDILDYISSRIMKVIELQ